MARPLALSQLSHHWGRTAVAMAGVTLAVTLMFMQLGFRGAVAKTAIMIYEALDFDFLIRSPSYLHLSEANHFPRARLFQAAAVEGVQRVTPFYVQINQWQDPGATGQWRGVMTFGTDPTDPAFVDPELNRKVRTLVQPQFALIDQMSRADYGPADGVEFGDRDIGRKTNIGGKPVEIVGHFRLGTGLAANGAVIVNHRSFAWITPGQEIDQPSMGLVRLTAEADEARTRQRLQERLASFADVDLLSRQEVVDFEHHRWLKETSLGVIFELGVVVSLLVGVAIVYQVLSTDVANMMPEYATLKAMGYRDRFLGGVVLQQAALLGVLGFVPGLVVAIVCYRITGGWANIPMEMTGARMVAVLIMSVLMCIGSGLATLRKLFAVDPAELF